MMSKRSPHPLPWQIRLGALAAAVVLALGLLPLWAGGVKFMRLLAKVSAEIAESDAASQPPPPAAESPPAPETPGVVSVGILPAEKSKP